MPFFNSLFLCIYLNIKSIKKPLDLFILYPLPSATSLPCGCKVGNTLKAKNGKQIPQGAMSSKRCLTVDCWLRVQDLLQDLLARPFCHSFICLSGAFLLSVGCLFARLSRFVCFPHALHIQLSPRPHPHPAAPAPAHPQPHPLPNDIRSPNSPSPNRLLKVAQMEPHRWRWWWCHSCWLTSYARVGSLNEEWWTQGGRTRRWHH